MEFFRRFDLFHKGYLLLFFLNFFFLFWHKLPRLLCLLSFKFSYLLITLSLISPVLLSIMIEKFRLFLRFSIAQISLLLHLPLFPSFFWGKFRLNCILLLHNFLWGCYNLIGLKVLELISLCLYLLLFVGTNCFFHVRLELLFFVIAPIYLLLCLKLNLVETWTLKIMLDPIVIL